MKVEKIKGEDIGKKLKKKGDWGWKKQENK
jgi:hypothetical protein